MEWTEAHNSYDLILAKEVRASEPWILKPRTVDRGKVWNAIADNLTDHRSRPSRAGRSLRKESQDFSTSRTSRKVAIILVKITIKVKSDHLK